MTWRDYNGMRGPVPTAWRAHDWQTCAVMRVLGHGWRCRRDLRIMQAAHRRPFPVRAPQARGIFARGTFQVKL